MKHSDFARAYADSIEHPEEFWAKVAKEEIEWFQPWKKVFSWDFPTYTWFEGGKLNITHNCLDRHVKAGRGDKTALIYVNELYERRTLTYAQLLAEVNKCANGLKSLGVRKGDPVVLYMPHVLEQAIAMLACARIGAVHSVVFAGFSAPALRDRIEDLQAATVITAAWTMRRGSKKELLPTVREAIKGLSYVKNLVVLPRDEVVSGCINFDALMYEQSGQCAPEVMDAEDPLFVLYTSGSTGKPKGIVHTCGGYSVYTHYTTKMVFDVKSDDIYWCTADTGWITGHSYVVYGPLSNGMTSVLAEGVPDYPTPDHWYKIIEDEGVSIFYTSPTALRMLRKLGDELPARHDLSALRILGTVGEPINPEVWQWYRTQIGRDELPIEDTWWQTETGGHMIVTLPGLPQKPGIAGLPFFGIDADIVEKNGTPVPANTKGLLVIRKPWPGALRSCLNNPERYAQYWNEIPGVYFTGDFAIKDADGYIQVLGRSDDVINVSGHRIGTAEIENALVAHRHVSEAAVIGKPDTIRGEIIKAFIILRDFEGETEALFNDLRKHVKEQIASMAVPHEFEIVPSLPKTRSGKIMRRVLKAKEGGKDPGDLSVLDA